MMKVAAGLFGLSLLGGLVLAAIRFSGVPRPPLVFAMFHSKGLALPIPLMVVHGLMAVVAFGLLFASL
jgi:hypothetical protein